MYSTSTVLISISALLLEACCVFVRTVWFGSTFGHEVAEALQLLFYVQFFPLCLHWCRLQDAGSRGKKAEKNIKGLRMKFSCLLHVCCVYACSFILSHSLAVAEQISKVD